MKQAFSKEQLRLAPDRDGSGWHQESGSPARGRVVVTTGEKWRHVATIYGGNQDDPEGNAEEMIRRFNAFPAVVVALDSVKAALGDRLLAKGPLSKEYARAVMEELNQALAAARER